MSINNTPVSDLLGISMEKIKEMADVNAIIGQPIKLEDGTVVKKVSYQNAVPDFSPYARAEVNIRQMTDDRFGKGGNFDQADQALAEYWTEIMYDGRAWASRDIEEYRGSNGLTWHEMSNMKVMQLVPSELSETFTHSDGVAEYNAMICKGGEK